MYEISIVFGSLAYSLITAFDSATNHYYLLVDNTVQETQPAFGVICNSVYVGDYC